MTDDDRSLQFYAAKFPRVLTEGAIDVSWRDFLADVFRENKAHLEKLNGFLCGIPEEQILPKKTDIWSFTRYCSPENVKVVIIGQDPYPTPGWAHGLAFSVEKNTRTVPPSLINILEEVKSDIKHSNLTANFGCLEHWAKQGVLLLNTVLTVTANRPRSHSENGWEQIVIGILRKLQEVVNNNERFLIFMLWGWDAGRMATYINKGSENKVLTAGHPSPQNKSGNWRGNRHFSKANDFLTSAGMKPIDWSVIESESAYHGHLTTLIDISHYKFNLPGGVGQQEHVHVASLPDSYRGKYRDTDYQKEEIGHLYADDVRDLCTKIQEDGKGVCAFIAESLVSCGGQVIPPNNYFPEVYKYVRAAGGICIADEVQVGFGRIGRQWWAFQQYDVVPDIVTMGKPMGNGHPVACVVTTREIAESFMKTGVEYFNTYGGNPVSCAIANAVFDTIEKENLRENAVVVGEYLQDNCQMLARKHKCIGDVRGVGLFIGIDVVQDRESRKPDTECAKFILQRMREEHILISLDGPYCNIIKMKPPMVFTKENVDEVISTLDRLFKEYRHKMEAFTINMPRIQNSNGDIKSMKEHRPIKSIFQKSKIKSI